MKVVTPIEVTPSILTSTDVVNDYSDWDVGSTPYTAGQIAVYENEVYESLSSNSDQPDTGAALAVPTWTKLGWSNQYRMFRDGRDSKSVKLNSINVELEFGVTITTLVGLGLSGESIQVVMTDPTDGVVYDETESLVDTGVGDWWEYFFLPYETEDTAVFDELPPYPSATVDIVITAATGEDAEAGRIVAGVSRDLGVANYGTSIRVIDYSTKERDGFGNLTLVPRRSIRLIDYDVTVQSLRIDFVLRKLESLSSTPALYIGDDLYKSTVSYGVIRDVGQGITGPSVSDLTIQVESF